MKSNGTLKLFVKAFSFVLILLFSKHGIAQPDYDFRNPVLESGTDLQIGAVYRFKDVKPGVDAMVSIADMTGGMTLNQLDGPSGFAEAFQPYINCAGSQKGYVEFLMNFVIAGTIIPAIQLEVPLTAIDIDGWQFPDDKLFECDEFEQSPAFYTQYQTVGGALNVTTSGSWVGAINTGAITYDGIDTVQKDVMFSAIHAGVTSVRFRVGADNRSASGMLRLRSVYFKKFNFSGGLLPLFGLTSFTGSRNLDKTTLTWELAANCSFTNIFVERSSDGKNYEAIGNVAVQYSGKETKQQYVDYFSGEGTLHYRLRIILPGGKYNFSNVLLIKGKSSTEMGFKIFPNIISSEASISFYADNKQNGLLMVTDYSGKMVKQQIIELQQGSNIIRVNGFDRLTSGNYIVVIRLGNELRTQKIMIR